MAFMCSLCPKGFKLRHHLQRHIASIHEASADFQCSWCLKAFSRRDHLLRHQRKHEIDEMVHPCDLCDKVFLRKDALSRHVKTHDNDECRSRKRPSSNLLCGGAGPGAESKRERYVCIVLVPCNN
ncbi:E3 SUMO-protein ligase EGR2 [Holothuria leucospilota]|uniref:E3 SUMO-protein ligase EGR2 n=1 Tax=Holothuria leucospilota TaxID=206669 RepID=A0A9Q1C258_HOLLE|nr:E3 SUMO-protein ligase EGR2 [Holothuria leucospilota]